VRRRRRRRRRRQAYTNKRPSMGQALMKKMPARSLVVRA
jgi:hypothetical protein